MLRWLASSFLGCAMAAAPAAAGSEIDPQAVRELLGHYERFAELEAMGPGVLPVLAEMYETATTEERVHIARTFYRLGWESSAAKRVLMADVHTDDQRLRLQVQWALGRVSRDDDIVATLLANMRDDDNPLFRDKAACALAHDQIHLDPAQKARLLAGLIDSLEDPKPQVRRIALQALRIHTGQTKGFVPNASPSERAQAVRAWHEWLEEYESQL